jgi:hypothetical protein
MIEETVVACWNAFCIATHCDGTAHVDATGHSWNQVEGTSYNPDTGACDVPASQIVNGVWTDYRRDPSRGPHSPVASTVEIDAQTGDVPPPS